MVRKGHGNQYRRVQGDTGHVGALQHVLQDVQGATFADELASDKDHSPQWIAFINFIKTVPNKPWLYKRTHSGREYTPEYSTPSLHIAAEGTQPTKSNFGPLLVVGALALAAYMFSR